MTQNISQILNIAVPNNISYIVCANTKKHAKYTRKLMTKDIHECKNCGNFICGSCTIFDNEKCGMCWQNEKCNLCGTKYDFRCWQCGKQLNCTYHCENGNYKLSSNKNKQLYIYCNFECIEDYKHIGKKLR